MTGANRQLDAAIDAFAVQSDVKAAQAEQLRRAIEADDVLLKRMNDAAKQGRLRSFVLDSSQDGPIGRTEIASGTMKLPPTVFAADTGAKVASLNTALTLQEMSLRFGDGEYLNSQGQRAPVSQEMVGNLQRALGASPALLHQVALAAGAKPEPHLENFSILPEGQGMGAAYDGDAKAVLIPANRLQARSESNLQGFDQVAMVYTLAHETQHAFNHERKQLAWREFHAEVRQIARDHNPVNDYTRPVAKILQASRTDEAEGEIAGWNAVLSMKQQADPSAGLEEMRRTPGSRAYLFITQDPRSGALIGKSGLSFNDDASVAASPQNIEAMGKNYFDRDSRRDRPDSGELVGLGPNKESNYPNYYARNAIEQLITIDRKHARTVGGIEPQMHLNMEALGLEERLIERLGLQISPRPQERQPYYDTSQSPPALRHFDHTKTGPSLNQHVPIDPAVLADEPVARLASARHLCSKDIPTTASTRRSSCKSATKTSSTAVNGTAPASA